MRSHTLQQLEATPFSTAGPPPPPPDSSRAFNDQACNRSRPCKHFSSGSLRAESQSMLLLQIPGCSSAPCPGRRRSSRPRSHRYRQRWRQRSGGGRAGGIGKAAPVRWEFLRPGGGCAGRTKDGTAGVVGHTDFGFPTRARTKTYSIRLNPVHPWACTHACAARASSTRLEHPRPHALTALTWCSPRLAHQALHPTR